MGLPYPVSSQLGAASRRRAWRQCQCPRRRPVPCLSSGTEIHSQCPDRLPFARTRVPTSKRNQRLKPEVPTLDRALNTCPPTRTKNQKQTPKSFTSRSPETRVRRPFDLPPLLRARTLACPQVPTPDVTPNVEESTKSYSEKSQAGYHKRLQKMYISLVLIKLKRMFFDGILSSLSVLTCLRTLISWKGSNKGCCKSAYPTS
jgi:hypothetical protein